MVGRRQAVDAGQPRDHPHVAPAASSNSSSVDDRRGRGEGLAGGRARGQQVVEEVPRRLAGVVAVLVLQLLREDPVLQPRQQLLAERAEHPRLRKVDVAVDEARQISRSRMCVTSRPRAARRPRRCAPKSAIRPSSTTSRPSAWKRAASCSCPTCFQGSSMKSKNVPGCRTRSLRDRVIALHTRQVCDSAGGGELVVLIVLDRLACALAKRRSSRCIYRADRSLSEPGALRCRQRSGHGSRQRRAGRRSCACKRGRSRSTANRRPATASPKRPAPSA